ncbi:MAG: AI-2E family transporter YdiK [Candidatus Binatia bacterium]
MQTDPARDLARIVFQLLAIGILIAASLWILRPFLLALAWATTITIATWPFLLHVQGWMGGRRAVAVMLLTGLLLLVLFIPLYFGVTAIVGNVDRIAQWAKSLTTISVPAPPAWLQTIPLVGTNLAARWQQLTNAAPEEVAARLAPIAGTVVLWFVSQVGSLGLLIFEFLLTVVIAAILYATGETAARGTDRFARRIAGLRGTKVVQLAAQAIRGVAMGIVVTALVQAALSGLGLWVAGIPFAAILTAAIFILAIAQIGGGPVLLGAVIWYYAQSGPAWGTVFLVWALFCTTIDNFIRPLLIKAGADLPLLLIFTGVIGGLVAFGVIGLFIGPVVLAVAYTLLVDWVAELDRDDAQGPSLPVVEEPRV